MKKIINISVFLGLLIIILLQIIFIVGLFLDIKYGIEMSDIKFDYLIFIYNLVDKMWVLFTINVVFAITIMYLVIRLNKRNKE